MDARTGVAVPARSPQLNAAIGETNTSENVDQVNDPRLEPIEAVLLAQPSGGCGLGAAARPVGRVSDC